MTARDAIVMGIFQGLAILPGVSRSGSTISSGLLMGYDKNYMVTYSFILSIPAILGACVLDIPEIIAAGMVYSWPVIIAGLVSSALVGFVAIRILKYLVVNDKFIIFSYYTFILGIVVLLTGLAERFLSFTFMI